MVMFSVSQVGKNAYRVGKTKGLFRVDAYEANTRHVLAHCGGGERDGWGSRVKKNIFFDVFSS